MKNKKLTLIPLFLLALLFLTNILYAQSGSSVDEKQPLKSQYLDMLEKSETYTEYKVIKRTELTRFANAMQDSLDANRSEINQLKAEVADQMNQISSLRSRITALEQELAESEELRDSLSFLGIQFNKATYHSLVWIIIAALAAFGVFAYSSFYRSNKVTARSKKEYQALELEFEEHKKKSHERQIKMGRELQTERNKVEELKSKLKAKSS